MKHWLVLILVANIAFGATPVSARPTPTEVLVVGGTPAGVAAAISAARDGANVTIVAQRSQLGGVLTDAMMDQWDLNLDTAGRSIQGGIFGEISTRLGDAFTPSAAAAAFADLVAAEPRIHVITNVRVTSVATSGAPHDRLVQSVTFQPTRGRAFTIAAPAIIDATDNGDVAARAGARYSIGRQDTGIDEREQAVTLMFTMTGVDWPRLAHTYSVRIDGAGGALDRRAWGYAQLMRSYVPADPNIVVRDLNLGEQPSGAVTVNAIDVVGVDGLSDDALASAKRASEREAVRLVDFLRLHLPGCENARIGRFADMLYVRETRHFTGVERLTSSDVWDARLPADTIGLSSYPLDLHPVTAQDEPAFAAVRHIYGIPFGTLVPRDLHNVLIASPAISATHIAAGSARVIPTTIEEGEAAGNAAVLALRLGQSFPAFAHDRTSVALLQAELRRDGAVLAPRADLARR